jgi:DDE superfamily endonuclease
VVPWFVFDGGYDSAQLSLDLAEERMAVGVRLRSDRCFYADPPPPPPPGKIGRPRRHGAKFTCADPASWPTPSLPFVLRAPVIEDAEVKWPGVSVADRGEPVASCSEWHGDGTGGEG